MPITRPSNYTTPPLASQITSPDGRITALVDTVWDGVLLKIDYRSVVNLYPAPFTATVWRVNADGTKAKVRSGDPVVSYSGLAYAYDHEAALGEGVQYYVEPVEYPSQAIGGLDRTNWIPTTSPTGTGSPYNAFDSDASTNWSTSVNQVAGQYFQVGFGKPQIISQLILDTGAGQSANFPNSITMSYSMDGVNFINAYPGTLFPGSGPIVTVNFPSPVIGQIFRITIGSSAARPWVIGNLQLTSSVTMLTNGKSNVTTVTIPPRAGGAVDPALWLKCVDNPSLSMRLNATSTGEGSFNGTSTPQIIIGSEYPSATLKTRQARTTTVKILTATMNDFDRMKALVDTDLLFMQSPEGFSRRNGYYLIGKASFSRLNRPQHPYFEWSLELTEIDRPPTLNQTLAVPGYSFDEDQQDGDGNGRPPDRATFGMEGAVGTFTNMLKGAISTFEPPVGASDWVADNGNTVLGTSTSILPHSGVSVGTMMSNAVGNNDIAIKTNKNVNVAPLQQYTFSIWVQVPNSSNITVDLQLFWKDATNTVVGSDTLSSQGRLSITSGLSSSTTSFWQYVTITAVSPSAAVFCVPEIVIKGAPQNITYGIDDVALYASNGTVLYQNQLTADQSGVESSLAGWEGYEADETVSWSTTLAYDGTHSVKSVSGFSGTRHSVRNSNFLTVKPGRTYRFLAHVYPFTYAETVTPQITWYDSNNVAIRTYSGYSPTFNTGAWSQTFAEDVAPWNAAYAKIQIFSASGTQATTYFDGFSFGQVYGGYVGPANELDYDFKWAAI